MAVAVTGAQRSLGKVFYGWWIVAGGFVLQGITSGLLFQAFGVYFLPLQAEFGWSRTLLSTAFSLARAESAVLGPVEGWLVDHLGPRTMVRVGTLMFASGFFLLSMVTSFFVFFIAFFFLSLGASLGGFPSVAAALANWFHKRRALAMALSSAGVGMGGGLVYGVAWAIQTYGWRSTAVYSGLIVIAVGLPLSQLFRRAPEPYGYLPDGVSPPSADANAAPTPVSSRSHSAVAQNAEDFTVKETLRSPAFWFLSLGHTIAAIAVTSISVHLIPYVVDRVGLTLQAGAAVVTLMTAFMLIGMVCGGYIGDRIEKRAIAVICMLGHSVALVVLAFSSSIGFVVLFAILNGLAWGARGPLMSAIRADYFGRASFATIMGFSSAVVLVGGFTGPVIVGYLADVLGGYTVPFLGLGVLTAVGSVFFIVARKPRRPQRTSQAHA